MSQVFFFNYASRRNILGGIERLAAKSELMKVFHKGDSVAIKAHMGELGNVTYVRPVFIRKVIDLVWES